MTRAAIDWTPTPDTEEPVLRLSSEMVEALAMVAWCFDGDARVVLVRDLKARKSYRVAHEPRRGAR